MHNRRPSKTYTLSSVLIPTSMFVAIGVFIGIAQLFPISRAGWGNLFAKNQSSAASSTYYVATTGNDQNSGTTSSPLRTINAALNKVTAGDTVIVRGGTYQERVEVKRPGTINSRITLTGQPGETVIIDGSSVTHTQDESLLFVAESAVYTTIKNLTITNSAGRCVRIYGDNVRIEGLKVSYCMMAGIIGYYVNNLELINNEVWEASRMNVAHERVEGWPGAVMVNSGKNVRIIGNRVHNNHGEGIMTWYDYENAYIASNTVYDNWSCDLYIEKTYNSIIENNLIYETETSYIPRSSGPAERELATGICSADEGGGNLLRNNQYRNNIVVNTRYGFSFWNSAGDTGIKDSMVENNTFVNTWDYGFRINGGNHYNSHIRNNIVYPRQGALLVSDGKDGIIFENNLFYNPSNISSSFEWGGKKYSYEQFKGLRADLTSNLYGDPSLVSKGGYTSELSKIKSGSAAIDTGKANSLAIDYFGGVRPYDGNYDGRDIVDIGAHEYAAPVNGSPTPTTVPNPTITVQPTSRPSLMPTPTSTITVTPIPSVTSIPTATPTITRNIIKNADFENETSDWMFNTTGTGAFTISGPGLSGSSSGHVAITTVGTVTQLYQVTGVLRPNVPYHFALNVLANVDANLQVDLIKHTTPFTSYGLYMPVQATAVKNTIGKDFTISSSDSINDARLRIMFLNPADYTVDDVVIFEVIPSDVNRDGGVNVFDLGVLIGLYGTSVESSNILSVQSDINHDGSIDIFDLGILSSMWGTSSL
ncbi:DUF1565 domain-containing protein [candidate division WWE3 bacterium]|nr:DUF1565 domain-containing protein [candidate division WWE3 bacterium]